MVTVEPGQRAGDEKTAHLVAAVIENERAPVLVRPLAGISMLVKVSAVELGQGEGVAREVRRHPVKDHADAALVQVVDKPREILRRAVPVRGGEEPGHLVTPRTVEGMLRQGQDLDVRVAHVDGVVGQRRGDFAVGQRPLRILDDAPPRSEMDLVDGDGTVQLSGRCGALFEPGGVAPLVAARIADNRRIVRGRFEPGGIGIRLQPDETAAVPDFELVHFALAQAGHEEFPDPGRPEQAHRMKAAVPAVEIADDRDPAGRGCPHRERHALDPVHRAQLGAELVVDPVLVAFVEQVEILLAERRQEGIGVGELADLAAVEPGAEDIAEDVRLPRDENFEEPLGRQLVHRPPRRAARHQRRLLSRVNHRALGGLADECPHHHADAAAVFGRVHPQQVVGTALLGIEEGFEVGLGDFHGTTLLCAGDAAGLGHSQPSSQQRKGRGRPVGRVSPDAPGGTGTTRLPLHLSARALASASISFFRRSSSALTCVLIAGRSAAPAAFARAKM